MSHKVKLNNIKFYNTNKYSVSISLTEEMTFIDEELFVTGFVFRKDSRTINKINYTSKSLFGRQDIGISTFKNSPTLYEQNPSFETAKKAKFETKIQTAFLYHNDVINIIAVMEDQSKEIVASFDVDLKSDVLNSLLEKLSPIKLLSLGRTGTTLFMNMLSTHPEIGINNHYNESNIASHYLNFIKYSYPFISNQTYYEGGKANLINIEKINNNELIDFPFVRNDAWNNYLYPKKLARFVKSTIDDYYLNATDKKINYFIEKGVVHDKTLTLMDKLYPKSKYIFLVRDFRDMYASIINFNQKRGYKAFGMENYSSDEDYIRALGNYTNNTFVNAYKNIKNKSILIKYEDLISNKKEVLKSIFKYLNVNDSYSLIDEVIQKNSGKSKSELNHITSNTSNKSIGKYNNILDKKTIELLNKSFDRSLEYFNYEV